jgi:predicted PhzF superfamily epimerase YddE/YHI9
MEMCGHATLGALWLLRHLGVWTANHATIETMSGIVDARLDEDTQAIEISQPKGIIETIDDKALVAATLKVLGLREQDLLPLSIVNASTSRVKTLIPLSSLAGIHALKPSFGDVRIL